MVIIKEDLTMQYILIALKLNIFQKKIKKFIGNKNVITNVLCNRIEAPIW